MSDVWTLNIPEKKRKVRATGAVPPVGTKFKIEIGGHTTPVLVESHDYNFDDHRFQMQLIVTCILIDDEDA